MDPFEVFDAGHMAITKDPHEAAFSILQLKQHMGAEVTQKPLARLRNYTRMFWSRDPHYERRRNG